MRFANKKSEDLNALRATQSGAWDLPQPVSLSDLANGNRKDRRRLKAELRKGKVSPEQFARGLMELF